MSFINVKFYCGTEDDYQKLSNTSFFADSNDNNYFFYTTEDIKNGDITTKVIHRLYLKDILIYNSEAVTENPWDQISEPLAETLKNYIKKIDDEQNITGNLTISGNIKADNFQENDGKISFGDNKTLDLHKIKANEAQVSKINTTGGNSVINGTNNEIHLNKLVFDNATESAIQNVPRLQFQLGEALYYLDLNIGELKVKNVKCETLEYDSNIIQADNADLAVNSITIGNVRLEDDGQGNLKITSLTAE